MFIFHFNSAFLVKAIHLFFLLISFCKSVDLFAVCLNVDRLDRKGFCTCRRSFLCLWLLFCNISHIDLSMENTSGLFDSLFLITVSFLVIFTANGNFALVPKAVQLIV